jgi:hypothetical protein
MGIWRACTHKKLRGIQYHDGLRLVLGLMFCYGKKDMLQVHLECCINCNL